ncbi:MAG: creatininase family protein [Actinomycetota bacterium]|nr:creatininase family protein [Actinomycetota bacterium]
MTAPAGGQWADSAWPDLARYLDKSEERNLVGLVPVGAIEQHGPHLPVGTDALIAGALCARAAELAGCIALPTILLGVSYGHGTRLPGTLSLTPDLLVATVHQYVRWAAVAGLRRLLFVNAHFGNAAALGVATDHIRLHAPQLRVGVLAWWSATDHVLAEVTADGDDIHANRAETSMMLAIAPNLVLMDRAADADEPDRTNGLVFRYTAAALSLNGVTGRPSEATVELGNLLVEEVVEEIAARVQRGQIEEPPLGPVPAPDFPF